MLDVPVTSHAELAFVSALAATAPELLATVPSADELTLARLRDELRWSVQDLDSSDPVSDAPLRRLQRNLFSGEIGPELHWPIRGIDIFSAPGEGRECVEIARRMLARAREGVPFDRMAVLLRSLRNIAPTSKRRSDAQHSRFTSHVAPAARSGGPRVLRAAPLCARRPFGPPFRRISLARSGSRYGSGGAPPAPAATRRSVGRTRIRDHHAGGRCIRRPSPKPMESVTENGTEAPARDGQLRAPWRWEKLLVDAAVIGSRERWRRRLDGLANELRARLTELSDEEEARAAAVARMLDDLKVLAAYALPLIDMLDGWPASASWGEWLEQLGELATRALRQPERVLAVLSELAPIAPVGPVSLHEVADVVGPLLLERAIPPPPQRYGKLFVGPVETARGLSFDTVFVPGLAERMFPRKITEEPILLDAVREQIGAGLATNPSRLDRERLALALVAGAAENRICFSYPRLDLQDQPRPRVPSFYALEALRASEGRLPDFTELARRAETATTARLGWPGPPDPAQAIDSAEHDLAILERLATAGRPDAGAARYLINANAHLAAPCVRVISAGAGSGRLPTGW